MKGKHNWKENNIEQKRKQKRTEGTEKKQFFKFQAQWTKTEKRDEKKWVTTDIASVCTFSKIYTGENTSRDASEEPQNCQKINS